MSEQTYDDTVAEWKKAYTDVLEVCEKYDDFDTNYSMSDIHDMKISAKNHLMLIEWYENYGIKLDHDNKPYSYNHIRLDDHRSISYYADAQKDHDNGAGRSISWSDDGRQPQNEWLYRISFSTGAYIFGEDYPDKLFQRFFDELASYKPDYSDRHNSSLYWTLENVRAIHDAYPEIMRKYREENAVDAKRRKAEKLRAELAALEKASNNE